MSNVVIPELPHANVDKKVFFFRLERAKRQLNAYPWSHCWLSPAGAQTLSYYHKNSYHWLQFPGLADFRISSDAMEIACYPTLGTPRETVRHLFLDQVLPRCLAHQGNLTVHASAVALQTGLIIFLGDSGSGKSTLAGTFHQEGQPAVSDDCVWVKERDNQILAVPSYGGLRLWQDSLGALFATEQLTHPMAHYSTKKRMPIKGKMRLPVDKGIPVLAVIVLSPPDAATASEVILDRLTRREAFIAIMKQTFQLDLLDLERMTRHIQVLGRIVPKLIAYRLSTPHDYDLLPMVRQKILETIL